MDVIGKVYGGPHHDDDSIMMPIKTTIAANTANMVCSLPYRNATDHDLGREL
jgi:hypothetical protein